MTSWSARIEQTDNAMDLLSLAREFLDSWEPSDLALIPPEARAQRIKGLDDFAYWHQKLVECYTTAPLSPEQGEKVRDMLHFFVVALQRTAQLEAIPVDSHEAAARLFSERSVPRLFTSAMAGVGER